MINNKKLWKVDLHSQRQLRQEQGVEQVRLQRTSNPTFFFHVPKLLELFFKCSCISWGIRLTNQPKRHFAANTDHHINGSAIVLRIILYFVCRAQHFLKRLRRILSNQKLNEHEKPVTNMECVRNIIYIMVFWGLYSDFAVVNIMHRPFSSFSGRKCCHLFGPSPVCTPETVKCFVKRTLWYWGNKSEAKHSIADM